MAEYWNLPDNYDTSFRHDWNELTVSGSRDWTSSTFFPLLRDHLIKAEWKTPEGLPVKEKFDFWQALVKRPWDLALSISRNVF